MPAEAKPILCYVTDRRALASASELSAVIRRAIAAGVNWIQVREKDLSARELIELAREALKSARDLVAGKRDGIETPRILVNDRLDVALAAGADGVHLGEASLPMETVQRWRRSGAAPPGFLVGVSCHSLHAAVKAERAGADYIFFGPVFATPSKAAFGPPQGLEKLAEVTRRVRIPALAIGGITVENAASCLAAGASGLAAIRLFQQSADLASVVTQLRRPL